MDTQHDAAAHPASPIFDALVDRDDLVDPLGSLPPDAAARDAAKREEAGAADSVLHDTGFRFLTRGVNDVEKAAVIAVLTKIHAEETERVRKVERRAHEPWRRSQRVPEGISELLSE